MKTDYRRYAPLGFVLSGLAFLSLIAALLFMAFERFGLYTPPDPNLLERILWISVAAFVVGFAIFAILDPDRVRAFLTGRHYQYGSNSLIMLAAFVGILFVANLLAYQYPQQLDMTEDKQHTLAPETIEALERLPQPVFATAFYSARQDRESTQRLFEDIRAKSNGKFDYAFIDPERNPLAAQEADVTGDGKIVLQMGEHREIVTFASEREITAGLIRLLNPEKLAVYFLAGDGEHDIENPGEGAYTRAKEVLVGKNYTVAALNLNAQKNVPEDAQVIVVAGPLVPLSEEVVATLDQFLKSGGSLVVLENPVALTNFGETPDPLAGYLAENWGIVLNDDVIIDTNSPFSPYYAVALGYADHPITQKMSGVSVTFPFARSLTVNAGLTNVNATPLVFTTEEAWGETDFASIQADQPTFDRDTESVGPMIMVAAAENRETTSRVVVFGNSAFAQDDAFDHRGNGDMLINAIDWAAEQEDTIALNEPESITRTLVPPGGLQLVLILLTSICLIPLLVVGAGIANWVARRQRG